MLIIHSKQRHTYDYGQNVLAFWQIYIYLLPLSIGTLWNNKTTVMRNDIKLFVAYYKCPVYLKD